LLAATLLAALLASVPAAAQSSDSELADYDALWLAATSDLVAAIQVPPAAPNAPERAPNFAQATAALNQHVAQLLETLPPAQRLRQHLVLLPLLAEATAALQALGDAAQAGDQPSLASARDWLLDSCARLRKEAIEP
jgi:hypothetical protein